MEKAATVTVRIKPRLKIALERMAEADVRTLSSLIEKILTDAARNSGHMDNATGDLRLQHKDKSKDRD